MTLETAVRLLEGKNLKADVQEEASEEVASGTIIRYEPEEKVALGSTVTSICEYGTGGGIRSCTESLWKDGRGGGSTSFRGRTCDRRGFKGVRQHDLGRSRHQSGR